MVENQHKKIKGYRDLSEAEIAKMNQIKELAEQVGALIEEMSVGVVSEDVLIVPDPRWIAIARTDLQTGFMALTRAIAKPTTF